MITKLSEQTSTTHHTLNKHVISSSRKRTHLSQNQIASLQASFAVNSLPDAAIRHGLSLSLGITERTVQIWFQNRRAKARKLENIANGKIIGITPGGNKPEPIAPSLTTTTTSSSTPNTTPRYQATFRSMMTPQLFEEMNAAATLPSSSSSSTLTSSAGTNPSSRPPQRRPRSASKPEKPRPTSIPLAPRFMSEEVDHHHHHHHHHHHQDLRLEEGSSRKSLPSSASTLPLRSLNHDQSNIVTLPAHLLRIGSWTRFANLTTTTTGTTTTTTTEWGLFCYCTKDHLIWQIQANHQQFRIHIPLNAIHQLFLGSTEDPDIARLNIQLDSQQLIYTMCLDQRRQQQQHPYQQQEEEWVLCGDFSEEKQASLLFVHEIQGHLDMLQQAVLTMITAFPVLAPKLVLLASPSLDDMSRDLTISPSATPEPSSFMMMNAAAAAAASVATSSSSSGDPMYLNHHAAASTLDKSMMLQAPFYYPPPSYDDQHVYNQMMLL